MWTCVYCEKKFRTNNGLFKHVRKLHLLYRCTTCYEDFSTKRARNRHERSHSTSQLQDTQKTENQLSDPQQIGSFTGLHQEDLANTVCSSFNFLEGGMGGSVTQNDSDSECEILYDDYATPVSSSLDVNKSFTNRSDPAQAIDSNWNHVNIVKADITHTIKDSVQEGNSLTSNTVNKSTSSVAKPFTAELYKSSVVNSLNDHKFSTPYNSYGSVDEYSGIKSNKVDFTGNDVPSVEKCIISRSSCGMVKDIKTNSTEQKHASEDVSSSSSAYSCNKSIKKSDNEQRSGIPERANVCSISPKMHSKSDNTPSGNQVMDFCRDISDLYQREISKTNEDGSSKTSKNSFEMNKKAKWLTKNGNFLLGGILGCKVKKTRSVRYDSKGTNLVKLSSTESKNKESALSRPLGKSVLESCNNHFDLICKAQEDTGKSNLRFSSKNKKKEILCTSSSSDNAGNKIKSFELTENKDTLFWGEISPQSDAEEINLSEEMIHFSTLRSTEKSKNTKSAHKDEISMDSPSSSSKYNFPKDSIMQHSISLRHFLWELAFCTETELKLMLKFVMTKDVELAVQLNSLKMLPFPKFPHHIPRLYINFLKKALKKEAYGGIVKGLEDLISPWPETVIKQAEKIDPIILTECEREEEMRKAVVSVLDFKDCGADKPVQDKIVRYLDLFLVELCMNLKKCENKEDPLSAAFPPGVRSVKNVQNFYVSDVIERHAVAFQECLGKYKTFSLHRRFIEKKTTDWLKKKGKYGLSTQVSEKNYSTTDSSYSTRK